LVQVCHCRLLLWCRFKTRKGLAGVGGAAGAGGTAAYSRREWGGAGVRERRCSYGLCPQHTSNNRWHLVTPYTNAGGKDWSDLVGQTLCSCCFQQYRGKASTPPRSTPPHARPTIAMPTTMPPRPHPHPRLPAATRTLGPHPSRSACRCGRLPTRQRVVTSCRAGHAHPGAGRGAVRRRMGVARGGAAGAGRGGARVGGENEAVKEHSTKVERCRPNLQVGGSAGGVLGPLGSRRRQAVMAKRHVTAPRRRLNRGGAPGACRRSALALPSLACAVCQQRCNACIGKLSTVRCAIICETSPSLR
jgi:hypothetical protein